MPDEVKGQIFGSPPRVEFFQRDDLGGKAALVKWAGDYTSMFNSLGLCMMSTNRALGPTHFAELYSACTGIEVDPAEMLKIGERVFNLMKAYIVREGLSRKDDDWPERFYHEPRMMGSRAGMTAPKEEINKLLDEYYELRGWSKTTGIPTIEKLTELGLRYAADELRNMGLTEE